MLDVRRLRLLRELAAHGTIAAAARACALTPSAISQQLSLLEREVGVPLLFREGRRLVLTEAARVLVGHTERILADLERASADVAELTSAVRGVLHVAAFPSAACTLVPGAVAHCREAHPDLRVLLVERGIPDAVAELRSGHLDLALIHEYNLLPRVHDAGVDAEPLVREPLLAALPAGRHPGTGPLAPELLAAHSWIAPHGDEALRAMLDRACGMAGFTPTVDYLSSDYTAIFALVRAGLGVSLVPRLAMESAPPGVELRELAGLRLERTILAAVRTGSRGRPPVAAVLDALRAEATGLTMEVEP